MLASNENKLARVGLVILAMWGLYCFSGLAYVLYVKVIYGLNETKNLHRYTEIANGIGFTVSFFTAFIGLWSLFSSSKKEALILLALSAVVFFINFTIIGSIVLT